MTAQSVAALEIGLSAVIVTVEDDAPLFLARHHNGHPHALPFGAFDPVADRTFELALRNSVATQTGFQLGHVEQLYTFGDQNRDALDNDDRTDPPENITREVSVGYLGLTPQRSDLKSAAKAVWQNWYVHFPWEDHRRGRPQIIPKAIIPKLQTWAAGNKERLSRAQLAFGLAGNHWLEERALERYELVYEAGLVPEAARDAGLGIAPGSMGQMLASDHRRILATGISRLRGKLKYRPVIFDLMPDRFTLSELQRTVEAILGLALHKQNFRRALDKSGLVVGLGEMEKSTGGRPAEYYSFKREVLGSRIQQGLTTPIAKRSRATAKLPDG